MAYLRAVVNNMTSIHLAPKLVRENVDGAYQLTMFSESRQNQKVVFKRNGMASTKMKPRDDGGSPDKQKGQIYGHSPSANTNNTNHTFLSQS